MIFGLRSKKLNMPISNFNILRAPLMEKEELYNRQAKTQRARFLAYGHPFAHFLGVLWDNVGRSDYKCMLLIGNLRRHKKNVTLVVYLRSRFFVMIVQ